MEFSANMGIGGFIIWIAGIVVWIKLFQNGGLVKALIGLVTCHIYTFIWGLQNMKNEEMKLKTWMYIWMGGIVIGLIINFMGGAGDGGEEGALRLLFSFI